MKQFILTGTAAIITALSFAQTNVNIEIVHQLNGEAFNLGQTGISNLDEEFSVSRLEYYLSGFSITHDGGQVTTAEDLYVLADAAEPCVFNFGEIDADHIDSFTFFIGVDPSNNHSDPASWPSDHALYPQNPSMHWGWSAGYRFLAFEGNELASNQIFQLHGLEDNNYFSMTVSINIDVTEGTITLQIKGNYEQILNNISLAQGPIVHGGFGLAQEALENMASDVFEYDGTSLGVSEHFPNVAVSLFPNPTNDGNGSIIIKGLDSEQVGLEIFDVVGKKAFELSGIAAGKRTDFHLSQSGIYIIRISTNGVTVATQKLVVQ